MVHLPIPYLNSFALAYTVSRVLYNIVYYNQVGFMSDSARTGMLSVVARALRSALIFSCHIVIYVAGMFGCLSVLVKCAGIAAGY